MKIKLGIWASALLAILGPVAASAGVIYRWQDVAENPNTGPFSGYIEFSYDVWSSNGHLDSSVSGSPENAFDPLFGIERFLWSNPSGEGIKPRIELGPMPCSYYLLPDGCGVAGSNTATLPLTGGGGFGATFDVTFGAILEGFVSVSDAASQVGMRSAGALWTIEQLGSDGLGICYFNDGRCLGSTGLWVLDLSTLPPKSVPEPSTIALIVLAIAALLGARLFGLGIGKRRDSVTRACVLLVALFCSVPASAGVIYRWQDITPNPDAGPFEGYIEFSDDAWRPGGHLFLEGSFNGTPASLRPTQAIERFSWTNPSGLGLGIFPGIGMALAPCSALDAALQDYCEPEDTFLTSGHNAVRFSFEVTFGALLTGGLSVDTEQAFVRMGSGSGPLWTIGGTASEVGGACISLPTHCSGSTGIWVLDLSTLPPVRVPEPSGAGLTLLGFAALLTSLKGRRSRTKFKDCLKR